MTARVATIVRIADMVVEELLMTTFCLAFEPDRAYRPQYTLAEMKTLHVTVVPKALSLHGLSRSSDIHEYQIDIAVQQKLANESVEEIDPLMALVEQIANHFRKTRLEAMPEAVCTAVENLPVYALEHLENLRQFTSVLTLTFRVAR
jgi:hypothetical protein